MHLTLVRHGQSVSNRAGRWQGQGDSPLSELGRAQAAALARRLEHSSFDRIIASDLSRAADTAAALGRDVQLDPIWRELNLGRWEGLTGEEVARRWPQEVAALRAGEDIPVGGEESWGDLARRTAGALEALRERCPDEHVLLVAHGGVIITLLSRLLGVPQLRPRRLGKLANTALSTVLLGEGTTLERYNDAAHCAGTPLWMDEVQRGRGVLHFTDRGAPLDPLNWQQAAAGARLEVSGTGVEGPCAAQVGVSGQLLPLRPGAHAVVISDPEAATLWSWNVGPA